MESFHPKHFSCSTDSNKPALPFIIKNRALIRRFLIKMGYKEYLVSSGGNVYGLGECKNLMTLEDALLCELDRQEGRIQVEDNEVGK